MTWTAGEALTLANELVKTIGRRNLEAEKPALAKGASDIEINQLSEFLGIALPPSYANFLKVTNGLTFFWYRNPILSTQEIIENSFELNTFDEPFPRFSKFIFSCGRDDYDAFAWNIEKRFSDAEYEVVELSEDGVGHRWPSFQIFMESYLRYVTAQLTEETVRWKKDW